MFLDPPCLLRALPKDNRQLMPNNPPPAGFLWPKVLALEGFQCPVHPKHVAHVGLRVSVRGDKRGAQQVHIRVSRSDVKNRTPGLDAGMDLGRQDKPPEAIKEGDEMRVRRDEQSRK